MRLPALILALLLTICASLATFLEPRRAALPGKRAQTASLMETLMGDSRRLFATHFLLKADAYFHSGFYPSIFDNQKDFEKAHLAEAPAEEHTESHQDEAHEEQSFLGEPRDWIDRFSRHFFPSAHTHLDEGGASAAEHQPGELGQGARADAREILPWLKLAAELDPNRTEIYVVSSYWLRTRLNKTKEAEEFLREGLRANPGDPAILFELGRIYDEAKNDSPMAHNLWDLALQKWQEREAPKKEPDNLLLSQIAVHLAKLEEKAGQYDRAIAYWNTSKQVSPHPEEVEKRIAELKAKQAEASRPPVGK